MPLNQRRGGPREPSYTIDARSPSVLRLAAAQARDLGHDVVGSAHLLLAILADEDEPAARLLDRHGVTLDTSRHAVAAILAGAHATSSPGDTSRLSPAAMSAMQRTSAEARRRGAPDLAPMHLLHALTATPGAADTLGLRDADLAAVRDDARGQLGA